MHSALPEPVSLSKKVSHNLVLSATTAYYAYSNAIDVPAEHTAG